MGKWKKKLGKFAKKAIPVIGLGLGAAALAKRRKAKALNAITDYGDTGPLSGKAGYEGDVPSAPKVDNIVPEKKPVETDKKHWWNNAPWPRMAKGGRIGHKSGGRVTGAGCAKRGFGRALKKK